MAREQTEWFTPLKFGVLLAALLFAGFPQVLLGTESFFFRDYGVLGYPFMHYARESFWRGELPLWNPLSNCGAPFLAQWGTMALYPFSLLYLVLPLPWGLTVFCFAHLVLAGLGMFHLARRWTGNGFAASVAGVAFVFSGFMFSCFVWPNYLVALGWMPWLVASTERAWREGRGAVVVAALVATLQMLSGVPEIVLLTWGVVGAMWVGDCRTQNAECGMKSEPHRGGGHGLGSASRVKMAVRVAAVVAITAGLAAAQLLPFFDLLSHSQREHGAVTAKWAMPVWGWANLLVPLFHCFETPQGQFFQYGQEFLASYYLGAGVLVLAVWAVWRGREWRVWVLGGLAVVSLVLALGEQTILYAVFKRLFPVVGLARYPVKFVALAAFVVPLLAGMAVARWQGNSAAGNGRRSLLVIGAAALVVMGALAWLARAHPFKYDQPNVTAVNALWRAGFAGALVILLWLTTRRDGLGGRLGKATGLGLLVVVALDAATHSPRQNPTLPANVFQPALWERAFETKPPRFGESRLMISPEAEGALLRSSVKEAEKNFMGKRLAEWSNLNVLDGLPKVNGASTLQLREQMQVQSMLYALTNRRPEGLLDFLGVSQISAPGQVVEWAARTNFLPLVTAGQRPVFVEGTNALPGLFAEEFNPREVVFLPREIEPQVTARGGVRATVVSSNISSQRLEFVVEADAPSLVVIAQAHYHPWEATVEGRPVPVWRANHAFQALEVPAGQSHVELVYRDRSLRAGGAVSAAVLLGCALLWLRQRRGATGIQ